MGTISVRASRGKPARGKSNRGWLSAAGRWLSLTPARSVKKSQTMHPPWSVRLPVYAASAGLLAMYSAGYLHAGIGTLALGLIGVTACAEFLKPQLGELAANAIEAKDRTAQWIIAGAAGVAILIGVGGGVVTLHVADAPRARYETANAAVTEAKLNRDAARAALNAVPSCTPQMPAVRCAEMARQNGPRLAEQRALLVEAEREVETAQANLRRMPDTGPGLPHVELWHKAIFVAGAEFMMFGVPFVAMRRARREAVRISPSAAADQPKPSPPVNTGGWEKRREKYGPTGRKQRAPRRLHVVGSVA